MKEKDKNKKELGIKLSNNYDLSLSYKKRIFNNFTLIFSFCLPF